jgi:glycosyltransferase involved in cell wall biosynthesis
VRIAVNVDGQFGPEPSGIQRYLDSLLSTLPEHTSAHELIAFAPALRVGQSLPDSPDDGAFAWVFDSRVVVDVPSAGTLARRASRVLSRAHLAEGFRRLHPGLASRLDAAALRARTRAATKYFDVLHLASTHCRFYEESRARSFVATIYDMTPRLYPETQRPDAVDAWNRYFGFARERCTRVLTISEAAKRDIVEHLGIDGERIDVTPLAPRIGTRRIDDRSELARLLAPWDLEHKPFVLYAGALEPRKNLPTLIEAFAIAADHVGDETLRLVLAGGAWGHHGKELAVAAKREGIDDRLVMTGYVSDLALNALMSACRAFAYVSVYEGFGLPPLEAMACGAPVVASNVSSLPEAVGDAALTVAPSDVAGIAAALTRLLTEEDEWALRRAASLKRAGQFSWHRTAALTLKTYEAAAAASPLAPASPRARGPRVRKR